MDTAEKLTLAQWDERYRTLCHAGLREPDYGGPLRRHADRGGDRRLLRLRMDNSAAALRLWNLLLSEEDRLHRARAEGKFLVGTMKDLGTVPVMAYALDNTVAFYPDGAWWTPCLMEHNEGLLALADRLGVDDSFCPVRAMLAALVDEKHFPVPDTLVCSVGATCDDVAAIAQRIDELGFPVFWWEIPHRRAPEPGEPSVELPGGYRAPLDQVAFVRGELDRVRRHLEQRTGQSLDDARLAAGIARANQVRRLIGRLRHFAYSGEPSPLPALEMMIAEILSIHYCSDWAETVAVLEDLLDEVRRRLVSGDGYGSPDAARVYWVNPPADLRAMNLLEECGGRLCGTDYMMAHAIDPLPEDVPPLEALARAALADPMVGSTAERAERICREAVQCGAEAVVVSRIPGASHCASESFVVAKKVEGRLG
ncbi:MAG TPA: 2-hydroxyacyl-CoA dehydratase family protein, partial [Thermoguttaceae bacterium]|nr:2-hydroxyacyl-CoA dehydratase family protein [Thermoguttaceae bacterium]